MLAVVAEQTGYPSDLLDMDLDLEADLGIDTVKQAEVFASIREIYGIERDDSLKLRDYPTLNHVVGFVRDRTPQAEAAPAEPAAAPAEPAPAAAEPAPAPAPAASAPVDEVEARVLAVVAEQTGYPSDLLDMDLDLEADLGIDTVKQAEVFASIRETLRDRARRLVEAARLPDAEPRRRVRARPHPAGRSSGRARAARPSPLRRRPSPLRPRAERCGPRRAPARRPPHHPPRPRASRAASPSRSCARRSTNASPPASSSARAAA